MEILPGFCFFHFLFFSLFLLLGLPLFFLFFFLIGLYIFILNCSYPPSSTADYFSSSSLIVCRVFTTYPLSSCLRFLLPFLISGFFFLALIHSHTFFHSRCSIHPYFSILTLFPLKAFLSSIYKKYHSVLDVFFTKKLRTHPVQNNSFVLWLNYFRKKC